MLLNILCVALGGATGSVARFLSSEYLLQALRCINSPLSRFPWPTLCVNVFGSLLAGILYFFVIKNFDNFDPRLKNFLLAGFLGGFTTFSAFSLDFFRLATAGQYLQAFTYATSSFTLAIAATFFGFYLAKIIFS